MPVLTNQDRFWEGLGMSERTAERAEAGRWLSPAGAAAYCSLSEVAIRRWLRDGRLTPYRPLGRRVVIDRTELDRLIEATAS
jgi:excisionase family DNA binding protein